MSHGGFLRQHSDDTELANHVMHDYTQADLDPQTRGMVDYAMKLTRDSSSAQESDIQHLRDLGLTDEQILSTVLMTCLYNFMNRLANGLGVELEPGWMEDTMTWLTGPAREQEWLLNPQS